MAEIIPEKEDTTIETDETSKFGTKFGVYALRDDEGTPYVLGLRELTTKSAKDTLDTFKEILFDLDNRYYTSQNLISQNILFHIRNTMSDRAATEMKFNSLLESYREEILPEVVRDWEDLNDDDKRVIGRLNNFFCGLHSLVHIAEVADKAILQTETTNFDGNIPKHGSSFSKKTESGTTRLIRTACKAFSYQGDPKSGCHGPFMSFIKEFLTENNFQSLPLTPFKGNRFNILFHNAGVIYLFHKKMTDFLKDHGSNPWVLFDLKVDFFVAGCKALGLVCKLITTPLWNLIEKKNIHIFDMNDCYLKLTTFLEDAANNVDNFMSGNLLPFGDDTNIKRDKIYEELVCASEHDADTSTILHVVLPAIAKLTKAHFKDHLPGGIYENPDTQKRKETMSVAKHNKFSESVFAYLDSLMRHKPHIKTLSAEAYIMFAMNRTSKWLEEKDDETVRTELKEAYKNVEATRKKFKERKEEIVRRKREILQEKLRKAELDRPKKEEESLKQTNDILYWGLWQTEDQVDVVLASMNVKAKIEALKAQFRFRKNILKQKASESHLYNFSRAEDSGRKNMAWTQLANNLKILIRESYSLSEGTSSEGTLNIVGKNISHRFESEGNDVWYDGHVVSQVSLLEFKLTMLQLEFYVQTYNLSLYL
ncbi:hypothetical protein FSP39_005288 [Pinctada imbricata]|uniref:Uncharacterized protein n=1 Tax=Pinctada imbricata TaxID=66713 RepID=A0AA89BUX4_PINIB|nr:hypothetical protein FSP39_005288 [Pinctada imbricata]